MWLDGLLIEAFHLFDSLVKIGLTPSEITYANHVLMKLHLYFFLLRDRQHLINYPINSKKFVKERVLVQIIKGLYHHLSRSQSHDFDFYYSGIAALGSKGELQEANQLVKELLSDMTGSPS